jgi:hypothetical protein
LGGSPQGCQHSNHSGVDEVLKEKELQLEAVTREIKALRIAALLLGDAAEATPKIPAQSTPSIP